MKCLICNNEELTEVFKQVPTYIWTGISCSMEKYKTILYQCSKCSHIQQNINKDLEDKLEKIYLSNEAQLSTGFSESNWGGQRMQFILDEIKNINIKFDSVLEIGCGKGELLYYFKQNGSSNIIGIEPSIEKSYTIDGIQFYKEFASADLKLNLEFDFIYSIMAFEHIKDINSVIKFISNHLKDDGYLFFEIPNGERIMDIGDSSVFTHEHIHIFTHQSLKKLCKINSLDIIKIVEVRDSFFVLTKKSTYNVNYLDLTYNEKIKSTISVINSIHKNKKIAFHGVNNSLNNIISWCHKRTDIVFFDNDEKKIDEDFFSLKVKQPTEHNLMNIDEIYVTAHWYFEDIYKQYRDLGFKNRIVDLTNV